MFGEFGLGQFWQVWLAMERLVEVCLGKECFGRLGILRYVEVGLV